MDNFEKRVFFYFIIIAILWTVYMFPYADGISYWNGIYDHAQERIDTSKMILERFKYMEYSYSCWLEIDAQGAEYPPSFWGNPIQERLNKYVGFDDILVIKVDSISLQWFDTIKIIKNDDTIKIALEDL